MSNPTWMGWVWKTPRRLSFKIPQCPKTIVFTQCVLLASDAMHADSRRGATQSCSTSYGVSYAWGFSRYEIDTGRRAALWRDEEEEEEEGWVEEIGSPTQPCE